MTEAVAVVQVTHLVAESIFKVKSLKFTVSLHAS